MLQKENDGGREREGEIMKYRLVDRVDPEQGRDAKSKTD